MIPARPLIAKLKPYFSFGAFGGFMAYVLEFHAVGLTLLMAFFIFHLIDVVDRAMREQKNYDNYVQEAIEFYEKHRKPD
jgi:hypothetical protein